MLDRQTGRPVKDETMVMRLSELRTRITTGLKGPREVRISAQLAIATLLLAASSQAAYHYVHYPSRTTFTPIFEKFNLAALQNNTVTFFVADQGANTYSANENFGSVLSQLKQAAAAWNSVGISDLRVAFGGTGKLHRQPDHDAARQFAAELGHAGRRRDLHRHAGRARPRRADDFDDPGAVGERPVLTRSCAAW